MKIALREGSDCAIAVDARWRHLSAIKNMLGPSDPGATKNPDSSMLFAKVLDHSDPKGLWLEMNSKQEKWPQLPVLQVLVPWQHVLGIAVEAEDDNSKKLGFRSITQAISENSD